MVVFIGDGDAVLHGDGDGDREDSEVGRDNSRLSGEGVDWER